MSTKIHCSIGFRFLLLIFHMTPTIILVSSKEIKNIEDISSNTFRSEDSQTEPSFYQGVHGKPGVDFPVLTSIPKTSFRCGDVDGYYADLETRCQVFHICEEGKKISFLCPNGTIFQQSDLICDWWYKVNCTSSPLLYEESSEQLREDLLKRKSSRRTPLEKLKSQNNVTPKSEEVTQKYTTNYQSYEERKSERYKENGNFEKNNQKSPERDKTTLKKNEKPHPTTSRNPTSQNRIQLTVRTKSNNSRKNVKTSAQEKDIIHSKNLRNSNDGFVNIRVDSRQKVLKPSKNQRPNNSNRKTPCRNCRNNPHPNKYEDSDETQIPEETASFVEASRKNQNRQNKEYPNHRETYLEVKDPKYYNDKYFKKITPITSQYLTTQSFNNGKSFVGSTVGTTIPNNDKSHHNNANSVLARDKVNNEEKKFISTISFNSVTETVPSTNKNEFQSTTQNTLQAFNTLWMNNFENSETTLDYTPTTIPSTTTTTTDSSTSLDNHYVDIKFNDAIISPPTQQSFPAINPRPFELLSTESSEYPRNLNTKLPQDILPPYPFFKISTARPFSLVTHPENAPEPEELEVENETASISPSNEHKPDEVRPGLVVPTSVSPQTLHSLASYFENIFMNMTEERMKSQNIDVQQMNKTLEEKLKSLLTNMTRYGYDFLFMNKTMSDFKPDSISQNSNSDEELNTEEDSQKIRKLAKIFSQALSDYLDDPNNFKESLLKIRPTEPPHDEYYPESELLNFSEDDVKSNAPPGWGFIYQNKTTGNEADENNHLSPDRESLSIADSQSFISQFNNLNDDEKERTLRDKLPSNHWTSSSRVTDLWRTTFAVDPHSINHDFETTKFYNTYQTEESPSEEQITTTTEIIPPVTTNVPATSQPEIKYELRVFPKLALNNSSKLHGILIDYMNTTTSESDKFQRVLKKLNTTEEEFLDKMKTIEENPLTGRLILLLIHECDLDKLQKNDQNKSTYNQQDQSSTITPINQGSIEEQQQEQSPADVVKSTGINLQDQDTRALQLLNSLYNIATKFGR